MADNEMKLRMVELAIEAVNAGTNITNILYDVSELEEFLGHKKTPKRKIVSLGDPTVNFAEENNFPLYDYQKELYERLNYFNSGITVITTARQSGMTTRMLFYAIHYALRNPGSRILVNTRNSRFTKFHVDELDKIAKEVGINLPERDKINNDIHTLTRTLKDLYKWTFDMRLFSIGHSVIEFVSNISEYDVCRTNIDLLLIPEGAFDKSTKSRVLRELVKRSKRTITWSTPRTNNWFCGDYITKGEEVDHINIDYTMCLESYNNDPKEMLSNGRLSPDQFNSEYECSL